MKKNKVLLLNIFFGTLMLVSMWAFKNNILFQTLSLSSIALIFARIQNDAFGMDLIILLVLTIILLVFNIFWGSIIAGFFLMFRCFYQGMNNKYDLSYFIFLVISIIILILVFSSIYQKYGLMSSNGNIVHDVETAIYFSVVTWSTLGYGDFSPTLESRMYAAIESILGYLCMAFIVANVLNYFKKN